MLAILVAVLLAAAPQTDTVFTASVGRVRGSVIEETAQGVSIQLLDGTTRRYDSRDVVRIEYGDGSVSTPRPPAPAAPPPAPAATQPAGPQVITPQVGGPPQVVVTGPGAAQASTIIVMPCPAPPPIAAAPIAATVAPPPPPPSPPPDEVRPLPAGVPPSSPIYLALGVGALTMSGNVSSGVSTSTIFGDQLDVQAEIGFRATHSTAFALYLDVGMGEPAAGAGTSTACSAAQGGCVATTGRLGILVRHTFSPLAPRTAWLAFGTGAEFGSVTAHPRQGQVMSRVSTYQGWEALRVMLGYDWRLGSVLGVGLYSGVSWGKYTKVESAAGPQATIANPAYHTMLEGGARLTLFP